MTLGHSRGDWVGDVVGFKYENNFGGCGEYFCG